MKATRQTKDDLVGVWRECRREILLADGTSIDAVPHRSQIMYSADGFMSVVIAPPNGQPNAQPRLKRLRRLIPRPLRSRRPAPPVSVAYAGAFHVQDDEVRHAIFTALEPYQPGTTLVRRIALSGDRLALTTPPDGRGRSLRIHWQREVTG